MNFKSLFSHTFHALDLGFWDFFETFGVFENFWDFCEIFGLGVVYLMIHDHALHSICIFTIFHAFRCVLEFWKLCASRFMHISCTRTFSFLSLYSIVIVFFLSSLSQIDCAWHRSTNLLWLRTLFVPGYHLLLIFPLFTFNFVIKRPIRTSLWTFLNVAFIGSAMWFCRTSLILLYPVSFTFGDGNLYVRYRWGVPSWSYRSSTPICMVSMPLYLSLLRLSEVHIS